jgi:hypothetical protein
MSDSWSVSCGTSNGKPLFVRVNMSANANVADPQFPFRLGIAVPLRVPDQNGFPQADESNELNLIEDRLAEALGGTGRLVLVITTSGMREFVSYVRSAEEGKQVFAKVRSESPAHKIQFYVRADPKWSAYGQFA